MAWKIKIDKKAVKEIASLDKPIKKRIVEFLKEKLAKTQNPRSIGEPLHGELKKFWKYRVGDYRIICSIEDDVITVLVLKVKHRKTSQRSIQKRDLM